MGRRPGLTVCFQGAPGSGKSEIAVQALAWHGAGAALLFPGSVEMLSYEAFIGEGGYHVQGFEDDFLPEGGWRDVVALKQYMATARALIEQSRKDVEAGTALKYPLVVVDTISGAAQCAVNKMLKVMNLTEAPRAQSPEGAQYYTGLQNLMNQVMRPLRLLRGLGADVVVTSHVKTVEELPDTALAKDGMLVDPHVPLIPGSFRNSMPGEFDLYFHCGVDPKGTLVDGGLRNDPKRPKHYVQWLPDMTRPTKSRLGMLSAEKKLPNEWSTLYPLFEEARTVRIERIRASIRRRSTEVPKQHNTQNEEVAG